MTKADIVKDAIRRFNHLPVRTIARYILHEYGPIFDGNLEKIRGHIRYYIGQNGERNREAVKEILKHNPQKLPPTWREEREDYKLKDGLWLILNDAHVPFHELKPIEAAVKYGQAEGISGILFNGDMQDCEAASHWHTKRKRDFDREIEVFIDFLDFMEHEFPGVPIVYKPGNHENRLPRYYQSKAPELIGMPLEAANLVLGLEHRGIEYLGDKTKVMAGKLPILHGHEIKKISTAVNAARGLLLRAKTWAMCGHFHTTSEQPGRDLNGTLLTTWSVGCLCDLSPDYCAYGNDWNWGFATVNVEKNGSFEVVNRRVLPSGKVV